MCASRVYHAATSSGGTLDYISGPLGTWVPIHLQRNGNILPEFGYLTSISMRRTCEAEQSLLTKGGDKDLMDIFEFIRHLSSCRNGFTVRLWRLLSITHVCVCVCVCVCVSAFVCVQRVSSGRSPLGFPGSVRETGAWPARGGGATGTILPCRAARELPRTVSLRSAALLLV